MRQSRRGWLRMWISLLVAKPRSSSTPYSSLEAQATSPVISLSTLCASSESLEQVRAQLLALLLHVTTRLLPDYVPIIYPIYRVVPYSQPSGSGSSSKHTGLIPPSPPRAFLSGNLHTGLFSLLKGSGNYSVYTRDPLPGLRIHRFDNPPHAKHLFRGRDSLVDSSDSPNSASDPLPAGFRFTDKEGQIGVLSHQYDLIRVRTSIPRSGETLAKLPGVTIYPDWEIQLQPCQPDSSNAASGSGDQSPLGEMSIAWAFLGIDGGLATLHVEPEYRRQGLACYVSREAMRRGMAEDGI
ncbi:hypothetical protein BDV28DRAFT_137307 [Aspergillus coremiiformis]|uniref:N-acetyltransferase domain-containing protein n=1 Tax=Aspergillus coremiiformis TaxID=138285 RepID=A0A5N6Z2J1_9EURO|nr:hypothetical protein BDV28DRAFT_137307 [Aspergillus coremiiformis]